MLLFYWLVDTLCYSGSLLVPVARLVENLRTLHLRCPILDYIWLLFTVGWVIVVRCCVTFVVLYGYVRLFSFIYTHTRCCTQLRSRTFVTFTFTGLRFTRCAVCVAARFTVTHVLALPAVAILRSIPHGCALRFTRALFVAFGYVYGYVTHTQVTLVAVTRIYVFPLRFTFGWLHIYGSTWIARVSTAPVTHIWFTTFPVCSGHTCRWTARLVVAFYLYTTPLPPPLYLVIIPGVTLCIVIVGLLPGITYSLTLFVCSNVLLPFKGIWERVGWFIPDSLRWPGYVVTLDIYHCWYHGLFHLLLRLGSPRLHSPFPVPVPHYTQFALQFSLPFGPGWFPTVNIPLRLSTFTGLLPT